jgi:hypothetical protein
MSLSKSKCWYSNNCLQFLKGAVLLWVRSLFIIVPRSWGLYYKTLQIDKMYGE